MTNVVVEKDFIVNQATHEEALEHIETERRPTHEQMVINQYLNTLVEINKLEAKLRNLRIKHKNDVCAMKEIGYTFKNGAVKSNEHQE